MDLRPLESWEELRACEELQREIWGEEFAEVAPAGLMKVSRRVGGIASGAFDEEGRLAGFVYGITGVGEDGRPLHWSHMLGVRPGDRDTGLGLRLKEHQRELLRERGVEEARWTFDPLVARNAHFNLNRLDVRVLDYRSDMYGTSQSELHRGLGTDRFVVAWDLEAYDPRDARHRRRSGREDDRSTGGADRSGDGADRSGDGADRSADGGVGSADGGVGSGTRPSPPDGSGEWTPGPTGPADGSGAGVPEAAAEPDAGEAPPVVRVEVPADIFAVRERDPDAAAEWRRRTRRAFLSRMEAGYRVAGFVPGPDRGFYVLTHPEVGPGDGADG